MAIAGARLDAQCAPAERGPTHFGPSFSAADSGRVYSHVVSVDGRELYFFKRVGSVPEDYRIFRSILRGSDWTTPEQLSFGGDFSDLYPSLSPDGQRLVFSSYRPAPGDTTKPANAHVWMARRQGNVWSTPQLVSASHLGWYHSGLSQDADGTLHLRLTTPDWRTQTDVMLRWKGGTFASTFTDAPSPAVDYWRARSGDTVYVWGAVALPGGASLLQVSRVDRSSGRRAPAQYFVTTARAGGWTSPVPAGGGLGEGAPNFLWVSSDGCYIHYTRDYSELMRVPLRDVQRR